MNTLMWIVTGICLFLLVAGFFIGFIRSWCRSLIRLSIVIIAFALSFFLSPVLVNLVLDKFTIGNTLSLFDFDINFDTIVEDYVGGNFGEDLSLVSEEVSVIAKALISIVVSVALFLISFISIVLISLVIYWIVLLIVKCVKKKDKEMISRYMTETAKRENKSINENNSQEANNVSETNTVSKTTKNLKPKSSIGLRFLGGFEGFLTMLIICFAVLIPVFGTMNICNQFLEEAKNKANEQVASAYTPSSSLICGQLYYTENESIGKVEGLIENYAQIKESYDKSPIGIIFKYTGLRLAGSEMFDYLTRVKIGDERIKFSDELVSIIKTYNVCKEAFIETKFDVKDNASLDKINNLVEQASESKIVENLILKLLPTASERFANGEKFFGFSIEVDGQYQVIVADALEVFKSTKSISRIKYNVRTIVDTIKIVNNHKFIQSVETNGLLESLESDKTIVKEVIAKLSTTEEFKNNLPIILNDFVEVLYNQIVEEKEFSIPENKEYDIENWEEEATNIQAIVSGMLETYTNILKDGNASDDAMLDELENIGKTIDSARVSIILSDSVKEFMIGLLNSDKVDFGDNNENIKKSLIDFINEKWDIKENPNFKFEDNFKVLSDTAKIAVNLNKTDSSTSLKDMASVFESIIEDENLKNQTIELLQNDELISSIVGDNDSAVVVKDIVESFVQNTTSETLEQDLEAGQAILDLVSINTDSGFNSEKAEELVETIVSSENVMSIIETAINDENNTSLQNLIAENVSNSKIAVFNSVLQSSDTISAEDKALLANLLNK